MFACGTFGIIFVNIQNLYGEIRYHRYVTNYINRSLLKVNFTIISHFEVDNQH